MHTWIPAMNQTGETSWKPENVLRVIRVCWKKFEQQIIVNLHLIRNVCMPNSENKLEVNWDTQILVGRQTS